MTLRAIAEQLGVKPVTVYRRLKSRGIDASSLRNADGEITPEGASLIASLFADSPSDEVIQARINEADQSVSDDTSQNATALQIEVAALRARIEASDALVKQVEAERDALRAERDRLLTLLEGEQAQRVRLLEGDAPRRGWFPWFRRRRQGD